MKEKLQTAVALLVIALCIAGLVRLGPDADAAVEISDAAVYSAAEPCRYAIQADPGDATILAKLLWGEARGVESDAEKAAVVWCVLNRVDATGYGMGGSVEDVVTFPGQFSGYSYSHPVDPELYALAADVLERWALEKLSLEDCGRVLPAAYLWFHGNGRENIFRDAYKGGTVWDWSLEDPYVEK